MLWCWRKCAATSFHRAAISVSTTIWKCSFCSGAFGGFSSSQPSWTLTAAATSVQRSLDNLTAVVVALRGYQPGLQIAAAAPAEASGGGGGAAVRVERAEPADRRCGAPSPYVLACAGASRLCRADAGGAMGGARPRGACSLAGEAAAPTCWLDTWLDVAGH